MNGSSAAAKYDEILDVAESIFQARGIVPTTLLDIAARAGVTVEELHDHFAEKDDLFLATSLRVMHTYADTIREAVKDCSELSGLEEFRIMMRTASVFALARPGFHVALGHVGLSYPVDSNRPLFAEYTGIMNAIVSLGRGAVLRGQDDGSVRHDVHVDQLIMVAWGGLLGVLSAHEPSMAGSHERHVTRELDLFRAVDLVVDSMRVLR